MWDTEQNREDSLRYEFSAIRTATNNFSRQNELGQGGFGKVYQVINLNIPYIYILQIISCVKIKKCYNIAGVFLDN